MWSCYSATTALSKCWNFCRSIIKNCTWLDHLFYQFKEASNAWIKKDFTTRMTLIAVTMKISWSYQWMKEKWYKEQLHLARGVSNLQKHPFSPVFVFLHHSLRYLTTQSMLYPHLVPVSLFGCMEKRNIIVTVRERNTPFSFCKILSYNIKRSPYNHKVLYMVKHALFTAIEAPPQYHRR